MPGRRSKWEESDDEDNIPQPESPEPELEDEAEEEEVIRAELTKKVGRILNVVDKLKASRLKQLEDARKEAEAKAERRKKKLEAVKAAPPQVIQPVAAKVTAPAPQPAPAKASTHAAAPRLNKLAGGRIIKVKKVEAALDASAKKILKW